VISLAHVAAIVKGLKEHNDGTRHFGSTMGYKGHLHDAVELGVITSQSQLTAKGIEWYERCLVDLPQGRATYWRDVGTPAIKG